MPNKTLKSLIILISLFINSQFLTAQTYPDCKSTNGGKNRHFITLVDFNQLWEEDYESADGEDEDGDGTKGYEDKTGGATPLCVPGVTYSINVTIRNKSSDYIDGWIDWNNDGDFEDANEKFTQIANNVGNAGPYSGNITVPSNQSYFGKTRMRIALRKNSRPPTNGDANYTQEGEVEDFDIDVVRLKDKFYYVSDDEDHLNGIDISNGESIVYWETGVTDIEAIAYWPSYSNPILYAANGGTLGTINTESSVFTAIGEIDGGGTANGSIGGQTLNDVDGLGFDARTGKLWASNRRSGYDILFQIDPTTGHFVEDVFGNNIDYVVIDGSGVYNNFDDISVSPINGKIYGVSNDGSNDQLLEIDQLTGSININTAIAGASDLEGLAFANDGTLYTTSGGVDKIYSINITTGVATYKYDLLEGDVESLSALMDKANRLTGNLWKDDNEDGLRDVGETTGLSGVTIELWDDVNNDGTSDAGDKLLQYTITDASGDYAFDFATVGHLVIKVKESTLPSGYAITTDNIEEADFTTQGNIDSGNDFGAINGSDSDGDGIPDFIEGTTDSDGDGVQNQFDKDSDNDGILDSDETTNDTDKDGIPDYIDLDSDNDGMPDAKEANGGSSPTSYTSSGRIGGGVDVNGLPIAVYSGGSSNLQNYDSDGDGVKDNRDLDSDNDGILDIIEAGGTDTNGDGVADSFSDSNNDGYHDAYVSSALPIPNNDSATEAVNLPNYRDIDSDGDSIDDSREGYSPEDYTTVSVVKDNDNDGILNQYDKSSGGASIVPYDFDSDGVPDYQDQDSDNDTGSDLIEGNDVNGDGFADATPSGFDVNKNGLDDVFDNACTGSSGIYISASSKNEEQENGDAYTGSSDIELVYDGEQQIIGIRFTGVNIAQGTSISSANIQFIADGTSSGAVSFTIHGDDTDNSDNVGGDNDISDRTQTTASASWSPVDWNTAGESSEAQKTSNIGAIIQEIVNRPGWLSGNAIMIIIEGTSTSNFRRAEWNNGVPSLNISTPDGLQYNCGSDIAMNDNNGNGKKDFRDNTVVLPVSLIEFYASMHDSHIEINWTTASEENNDYFLVEKSSDNLYYEEIDMIYGAGNSNIIINYKTIDYNINEGMNYYRLKQVDFDGSINYSNVIAIRNVSGENFRIYPNPTNGQINIDVKEDVEILIYSIDGRKIYHNTFESNTNNSLDLSSESKGIYIISYIMHNEVKTTRLIIK